MIGYFSKIGDFNDVNNHGKGQKEEVQGRLLKKYIDMSVFAKALSISSKEKSYLYTNPKKL